MATWLSRIPRARITYGWWTVRNWPPCWWKPTYRCWSSTPAARPTPTRRPAPVEGEATATDILQPGASAQGSLAQEVMDAGVAGVVAMRYNVFVVTAAQFVADLVHCGFAQGQITGRGGGAGADTNNSTTTRCGKISSCAAGLAGLAGARRLRGRPHVSCSPEPKRARDLTKLPSPTPRRRYSGVLSIQTTCRPVPTRASSARTTRRFARTWTEPSTATPWCCCTAYAGRAGKRRPRPPSSPAGTLWTRRGGRPGAVYVVRAVTIRLPRVLDQLRTTLQRETRTDRRPLAGHAGRRTATRGGPEASSKQVPVLWVWDNVETSGGFSRRARPLFGLERDGAKGTGGHFLRDGHFFDDKQRAEVLAHVALAGRTGVAG